MQAAPNVWIAGDLGLHAEQATVAMGEGSIAAIWIHKALQQMKKENLSETNINAQGEQTRLSL
ncbi:hypothetical protein D3C76_1839050 [compost metagenome]